MDYTHTSLLFLILKISLISASEPKYTTSFCPGIVGPVHGIMLMFDPQQRDSNVTASWYIPERDLDCWVTLKGQPSTKAQFTLELRFKGTFSIKGYGYGSTGKLPTNGNVAGTDCETGFLEIYEANDEGVPDPTPSIGPICGSKQPAAFYTNSQSMVIRVFVAAVPHHLLHTTMTPTTTPPVTTAVNTTAQNITLESNATTEAPLSTTVSTPPPPTLYEKCLAVNKCPYMKFYADFTSYIPSGCYEDGMLNDDDQIYCLTGRCIHISLLCDGTNSNNCGDWSDQMGSACIRPTLPPEPPPAAVDYTWIFILMGVLVAVITVLLYCCWRPGYIPWRLARLRNTRLSCIGRCCRTRHGRGLSGCCGPTEGWFRCCCCKQRESDYPNNPPDPNRQRKPPLIQRIMYGSLCMRRNGVADGELDDIDNCPSRGLNGSPWINYAFDDGMHIRESR